MSNNKVVLTPRSDDLHKELVQRIYTLIDQPDAWPALLQSIDALIESDNKKEQRCNITPLLPHIERVNMLIDQFEKLKCNQQKNDEVLKNMPMAMMLIESGGRIIFSNSRAHLLLKKINKDLCDNQFLHFKNSTWQASLQAATRAVISGQSQDESLCLDNLKIFISRYGQSQQLLLFLSEHTVQPHICRDTLQQMYGLTLQEARLSCELINGTGGVNFEDAAKATGIQPGTARSYLKRVFAKTGTHSQADLVKMVLLNPALTLVHNHAGQPQTDPHLCCLTRLPSGRTISWAEYGAPQGSPLLLCHAITGCRLSVPDNMATLKRLGIRLIVPDRAGYGMSTPAVRDAMTQWLDDMRYFIAEIGIQGCDLLGHSVGGAHAIMLARNLPELIGHLYLVSSAAPSQNSSDLQTLLPLNRMLITLSQQHEPAARALLTLILKRAIKKPYSYFTHISATDQQALSIDGLKEKLIGAFAETCKQGVEHMADECIMIANHYHVKAKDIHCPVTTWHGQQDRHTPVKMMNDFERGFPSLINRHRIDAAGHYLLFSHWSNIIKAIAYSRNT